MAGALTTVADLINTYRVANTTDRRREDARHARWWVEHFGTLPASGLTTERILRALEHVKAEGRYGARAGSTVGFYLRFLRRVTAWGSCVAMLPIDPCAAIPLPKEGTPVLRVMTEEEETQLCQALGRPYSLWVRLAVLTGLEQSEQFNLLWRHVQMERGTMMLPQGTTGTMVELSLPPDALTILRLLRQDAPTSIWVCPDPHRPTRPADPHNFYVSRWTRTIARLGMPRLAWKDLRHTCGVRLAKQGVPIEEIASFLRQRELRLAYYYRAWLPGVAPKRNPPKPARVPVFTDLTDGDLRALIDRPASEAPPTFGEVCRLYAVHFLKQGPSRVQFERIYKNLLQQWEARPLAGIARKDIRLWYMGLSHTPAHANKALTFVQRVYNVAIYHLEMYEGLNPANKMPRYPSPRRERFLSEAEAQRFMEGIPHLPPKPGAYFLTLVLTGARLSEARCMRWTDVEWTTRLWKKPRTKNGSSQFIPLPVQVVNALARLPRTSEWVFPGDKGKPWSIGWVQTQWYKIRRHWNMEDVTIHDLRRTCASHLAISGENLPTIQNVLNHKSLAHTAIYARLNTKAVDRALQTQADKLCGMVAGVDGLPALTHDLTDTPRWEERDLGTA
ncbi:MAG TPA: site-specific integrase [Nitrospiraceae bacterium]|jgi:integrase|nr:site-specific integrase [Nitrospiraceae bacterium]